MSTTDYTPKVDRSRKLDQEKVNEIVRRVANGERPTSLSEEYHISVRMVYIWVRKTGKSIRDIRHEIKEQRKQERKKQLKEGSNSYYSYVQRAYERGEMTRKQRNRALNQFYQNRSRYVMDECNPYNYI